MIRGNFDNTAGLASSLCICYSILLGKSRQDLNKIILIVLILILIAVLLTRSRTAIITTVVVSIHVYRRFIPFKKIFIASLILLGSLFFININSGLGRLFVWKCSVDMIIDSPIFGHGLNGFSKKYMYFQRNYFEGHSDSIFKDLADNVKMPFNEILNLLISFGFAGTLFIIILLYLILRDIDRGSLLFKCLALATFSIICFGMFSYPSRYPFSWLILIMTILESVFFERLFQAAFRFRGILFGVKASVFVLTIFAVYLQVKRIRVEMEWFQLNDIAGKALNSFIEKKYDRLYVIKKNDNTFLYNYSVILNKIGNYEKSKSICLSLRHKLGDYELEILTAYNFLMLREYGIAEKIYLSASNMCPNRFVPLYGLFHVYYQRGDYDCAKEIANKIVLKKIKINSRTVQEIITEMKTYLKAGS
ncbi:O-antigen ligase family protein [Sphingobacterium griseoflavum]|nr:O-antigen ligase family protein [Sphingobacterium griseoflavum]